MTRHHVAISCCHDSSDPSKMPVGFGWIATLLTAPYQPNYQITMWCHGDCLKYVLNNYETVYGNPNPHQVFLAKLVELGGKIIVCDVECQEHGIAKEDLAPFVTCLLYTSPS